MPRRRRDEPEDEAPRRPQPRPARGSRLAFYVLVTAAAVVATRATVATVLPVHGDGMAPTLLDGDVVLMTRGDWTIGLGDLVVYAPTPAVEPESSSDLESDPSGTRRNRGTFAVEGNSGRSLPNAAVVDPRAIEAEVQGRWENVGGQDASSAGPHREGAPLQLGRVLARPGDRVTFGVHDAALGLAVNGVPLRHKVGPARRLVIPPKPVLGEDPDAVDRPTVRTTAYEHLGDLRYEVLVGHGDVLPALSTDGRSTASARDSVLAPGYLIISDNRPEGACCDSRTVGWIHPDGIEGEVVARLSGTTGHAPDADPASRGPRWLP